MNVSLTRHRNLLLGVPEQQASLDFAIHAAVLEQDIAAMPDGLDQQHALSYWG